MDMLESVRALLERIVDYAGLFPPAGLGMVEAVANYRCYAEGEHEWMLGRFVVPASRLNEFETVLVSHRGPKMHVSVIAPDVAASMPAILAFNAHVRDAIIDSIETRADTQQGVRERAEALVSDRFSLWFESPESLIEEIAAAGCRAKIRTATATPDEVIRFIQRCREARVPFKATAGLHHPLPGPDVHGFLNVFIAAVLSASEMPSGFSFEPAGVRWGDRFAALDRIREARKFAVSFGSCSFEEPVHDLKEMGLL